MKGVLIDSVDAMLSGLMSGWLRPVTGLLAVVLGLALAGAYGMGLWVLVAWLPLLFTGLFSWSSILGTPGFFIGFFLLLIMGVAFVCYLADHEAKKSWYVLWSVSCVYFAFTIDFNLGRFFPREELLTRIAVSVAIFAAVTFLYWGVPRLLERWAERRASALEQTEPQEPQPPETEQD